MTARTRMTALTVLLAAVSSWPATTAADNPATAPAPAPTTRPAAAPTTRPAAAPTTRPAAAPTTRPADKPAETPERNIRFQFDGIPYTEVVRQFAQIAKKPIMGDLNIEGTLTFFDSEPYTYEEALDTLNIILEMRGYALKESGRFLRLYQVAELTGTSKILGRLEEAKGVRASEIVTVVLPVKYIDAAEAAKAVVRMVSSFGAISPLGKGKGIVITDRLSNIQRIRGFINMLDTESMVERQTKTFDKLYGSASVPSRRVYSSSYGRYITVSQESKDVVTTTYDERTNLLLLVGTSDRLAMAEQLVQKLDVDKADAGDLHVHELKNAKAEDVAKTIVAALPQKQIGYDTRYRRPIMGTLAKIIPDSGTNRLIWSAPADQVKNIEELIKELDADSTQVGGAKVIPLKVADAKQLATVLAQAVTRTDSRGRRYPVLAVSADTRTNSLIVSGSAGDMRTAMKLIEELDSKQAAGGREIHVVYVKNGDVRQLASSLMRLFSETSAPSRYGRTTSTSALRVEAEPTTSSLLIACQPGDWPTVQKLLDQLKTATATLTAPTTRILPLQHAKAAELAATLMRVYPATSASRSRSRGRSYSATVPVVIAPSERTNSLLVSASGEDHEAIAALVKSMDVESTAKVDPVRIVTIKSADAKKLADTLRAMLPPVGRREIPKVFIEADPTTNSVLIRAPETERKMLEQLITSLDKPLQESARETRLIRLEHASATEVAAALSQLFPSAAPVSRSRRSRVAVSAGGDEDRVIITAAPGDRAIIVDAPRRQVEQIAQLAKSLDTKDALGKLEIRMYHIPDGGAADLARALARLFAKGSSRRSRTGETSTGPQPRFEADPGGAMLMIAATETQFERIEEIIKERGVATAKLMTKSKIFLLKFAKAEELAGLLGDMLRDRSAGRSVRRSSRGASRIDAGDVRIVAIPDSNKLIVKGTDEQLTLAAELIETFDTADLAEDSKIHIVPLKFAKAEVVVANLENMLPQPVRGKGQEVFLRADPVTNAVLIRAPKRQRMMLNDIIDSLDQSTETQARETKIIELKNASAASMAVMLGQLFRSPATSSVSRSRSRSRSRTPASLGTNQEVLITPSPNDRALVVDAPRDKMKEITDLVASLDSKDAGDRLETRTYQLTNSKASNVAASLGRLFALGRSSSRSRTTTAAKVQPRFEADAASNQLLVAATGDQFTEIEAVIKKLEAAVTTTQTKTYKLKFARADELLPVMQSMLGASGSTGSSGRSWRYSRSRTSSAGAAQGTRISALSGANALVVQGAPDAILMAEKLIAEFDTAEATSQSLVKIIEIKNAKAQTVAETLRAMLPAPGRGQAQEVFIQAESLTNSVLVRAPAAQRTMIEEMIAKLDAATQAQTREMKTIRLEHASASAMATMLERLYAGGASSSRSSRSSRYRTPSTASSKGVVITPSPNDQTLVVEAPKKTLDEITALVATLDTKEATDRREVRIYKLSNSKATEVARSLTRLYTESRSRTSRGGRAAPASGPGEPRFEADSAANQLIVSATEAQFVEIEKMVKTLQAATELAVKTATFKLQFAQADELVKVLEPMLGQDAMSRYSRARRGTSDEAPVRISAMSSANTVVVQGPPEKVALAEELVKTFDTIDSGVQVGVQVVKLSLADATTLAASITQSLGSTARARSTRGRNPFMATGGTSQGVTVTAEPNSNSILVRGPAKDIPEVVAMIKKLDGESSGAIASMRIFPLTNGDAAVLATSLGKLFQDVIRQQTRGKKGATPPPFSVTANERTNSLVISTTPAHFVVVEQLLANLDKTPDRPRRDVAYVWLENADATEVAAKLDAMYPDVRGAERPVIEADFYTNAITVIAKDAQLKEIEKVIQQLDKAAEDNTIHVRVIALTKSRAENMAKVLQRVYGQMSDSKIEVSDKVPPRPRGNGAEIINPGVDPKAPRKTKGAGAKKTDRPKGAGKKPAAGKGAAPPKADPAAVGVTGKSNGQATTGTVTIAVDKDANALIISGTRNELADIESLVEQLAISEVEAEAEFRVFKIEKADPAGVAQTLMELFNPKQDRRPVTRTDSRGRRITETPPAAPPVISVVADQRTRSIIVRAKPIDFEMVEPMIKHLDEVATIVSEVRVFVLKNSDPVEIATNVRELFAISSSASTQRKTPQTSRTAKGSSKTRRPTPTQQRAEAIRRMIEIKGDGGVTQVDTAETISITPNQASNSVVVVAPADAMGLIEKIIQELDQSAALATTPAVRMYPLKHAEVGPTVEALQSIFSARGRTTGSASRKTAAGTESPIVIAGDEGGKQVIVSAPVDKHELIAKVIEDLDDAHSAKELTVKVYRIQHADATTVSTALSRSLGSQPTGAAGRGAARAADAKLRISPDSSSNTLVVRASAEDHLKIAKLLTEIDVPATAKLPPVRVIPLNNADAANVAQALTRVMASSPSRSTRGRRAGTGGATSVVIEADSDARMLMVRADDETFEKIRVLAAQLDTRPGGEVTRTILPLKHAQAAPVAAALTQTFAPPKGKRLTPDDLVTVVPETVSNSLIVSANAENLKRVQAMLAKLDTETAGGIRREILILKNAQAADLATALQRIAAGTGSSATRGRGRSGSGTMGVTVTADASSNALIMSGPSGDLDRLMAMAMQLDQASLDSAPGVYIIPLENGDASAVASMIRDLYREIVTAARLAKRSVPALAVSADERANALVIAGSKATYEQVSVWVAQIEKMKPSRGGLRLIMLEHADPAEVEKAIQEMFGTSTKAVRSSGTTRSKRSVRGPAGATGATSGKVQTTALPNQRAVLVNASEADFEEIQKLVKALDAAADKIKHVVQVFKLEHASNERVAQALGQVFRTTGRTAKPEDTVIIRSLTQTNTLIVSATKEKMTEVAHLIEQLDEKEVAPTLAFKIYTLENAQPTKVLPTLQKMLVQVAKTRPGETIDVQADERTRSIIVTARPTVFDQISQIIKTLDKAPAYKDAEVMVIQLKRADAEILAKVLTDMLRPSATQQVTPEARALQEQVRLLRVSGALGADKIPELDLTKPIKIVADPGKPQGSNALVITSTADNLKAMRAIVSLMDTMPLTENVDVRLIHLENADAASVVTILEDIFNKGKALAGRKGSTTEGKAEPETPSGKALVNPLAISADERTNTLVLGGMTETLALAELVIRDLDRQQGKIVTQVKLFRLKHADVSRLLPVLQAVFAEAKAVPGTEGLQTHVTRLQTILDGKKGHVGKVAKAREALTIQGDAATNILVVAARDDVMPLITDVVETMDVPGAGSLTTVRLYPMLHADATALGKIVSSLYTGPNAQLIRNEDKPTVAVDARTNSLVISGSDKAFAMLDVLLKQLDRKTPIELRDIRLVTLKNADATTLAATLQTMMDARVQRQASLGIGDAESLRVIVVADARSNSLIVGGSADGYAVVKDLAESLDGAAPALGGQVQLIPLKHGNAGVLATTLSTLFDQRYAAAPTADVKRQKPIILPDLRSNSLLVAANNDDSKVLKSLLAKMDVKLVDPAVKIVVIPMKLNDASVVGPVITKIFAARLKSMTAAGQTPVPQDQVDVATDTLSNALIVSASEENLDLIEKMVAQLDAKDIIVASQFKVFQLKLATAATLQPTLEKLLAQRLTRGTRKDPISVIAEPRINALIVGAGPEDMKLAESLIAQLDKVSKDAESPLHVFPLSKADAKQVATTLENLYKSQGASTVTFSFDERINAIVVQAGAADAKRIAELVGKLDQEKVASVTEIRVFPLSNADATELATLLNELLNTKPKSLTQGSPNRQTLLQFVTQTPDGKKLIANALQEGVQISADKRANSLVVSAPLANMPLLTSLITALDSTNPRMAEIKVFTLKNADALRMSEVLQQLFRLQQTGSSTSTRAVNYRLITTQPAAKDGKKVDPKGGAKAGEAGASATVGSDEQSALNITVDGRTNSLLVGGTRQYVALCTQVIEELDSAPAQEREMKVYHPRNAKPEDIETALQKFLDMERQRISSTMGNDRLGSVQRLLEREVAVVSETTSGSLLLSASPRYFKTLMEMVEELDKAPPQVLIQVMLAEVMLDDTTDTGIDWLFRNRYGKTTVRGGSELGVEASIAQSGGLSLSVSGSDLSFFLQALQNQGRLEVLSRPQILASNNQEANINVGQRVPLITNSRITDEGDTINTISYEQLGITLTVLPRISPDGFVRMEVSPEISALSSSSVEISTGVEANIITNRSAQTTATVRDGHTIVIGGLITTRDDSRDKKVPILGDMPFLGALFRSRTVVKERTELLIILTPRIIRNDDQADAETDDQLKRLKLLRQANGKAAKDRASAYLLNELTPISERKTGATTRPAVPLPDAWRGFSPSRPEPDATTQPTTRPAADKAGGK